MKKLLITMLLALTMCVLLAFAVSAEEYELVDDLGTPSWYTGNYELMTDKTSKVVLSNGNGTYTAYPAYYILKYSITVKDGAISEAYINGFDYSFINDNTDKNYASGAIYKIELPYGLTTIKDNYFGFYPKEANVVELVMSDSITSVAAHAFRNDKSSTKLHLKKIVFSKNLTSIGAHAFLQLNTLETVEFPGETDAVLDLSASQIFSGCSSLQSLDLSKRNIKVLGPNFLENCTSLEKLTLPETLEEIGSCSIYKCPKLYLASDFLPKNLKKAGFHFLSGCKSVNSVLFFPEGFEGFTANYNISSDKEVAPDLTFVFLGKMEGTMDFQQASPQGRKITFIFTKNTYSDLNGKFLTAYQDGDKLTFIGKTADANDANYIENTGVLTLKLGSAPTVNSSYGTDTSGNTLYAVSDKSYRLYFCGGDSVELCHNVRTGAATGSDADYITTPFTFDRQGHMDAGVHYDLIEVLSLANCGVDGVSENTCVLCSRVAETIIPATGNHTAYEVSPCADKCEVCKLYVQKATQSHLCVEFFAYENGYMSKGAYGQKCKNEGCAFAELEEKDALIKGLGFSVPEAEGFRGINYGYATGKAEMALYERVNNCTVELGVLVALGENFAKDEKVFEHKLVVIHDFVEIVVNYGNRTDIDDVEIVLATTLTFGFGEDTEKVYLQESTDKQTTDYTSPTYGTLYGISYSNLTKKD